MGAKSEIGDCHGVPILRSPHMDHKVGPTVYLFTQCSPYLMKVYTHPCVIYIYLHYIYMRNSKNSFRKREFLAQSNIQRKARISSRAVAVIDASVNWISSNSSSGNNNNEDDGDDVTDDTNDDDNDDDDHSIIFKLDKSEVLLIIGRSRPRVAKFSMYYQ